MSLLTPGELEVTASFRQHLGPRFVSAGVTLQFHNNQEPGIHLKTVVPDEYRDWLLKGVREGVDRCFPQFLAAGSVWVTRIQADTVSSSAVAFYRVARLAVHQALLLKEMAREESISAHD